MAMQNDIHTRYITAAKDAGCPPDQLRNFLKANIVLQPRQLAAAAAARLCDLPDGPTEIGYGGARGGGKSHWLAAQIGADDCQRFPGLKALILRKVGIAQKEAIEDLRASVFSQIPHTWVPSRNTLKFKNGSRILIGHYRNESDIDRYLGLEYDEIGIEEGTTLSATKYKRIKTFCRTSKPGWRPRIYIPTNPGNIGHAWYKARFIAPYRSKAETATRFIPATVSDNRFVNEGYKKELESLTGWEKKAWLYGDWDIAAGQFFTNFRAELDGTPHHVIPHAPQHGRIILSLDYGFTHYTAAHLHSVDGDGNITVFDEHYERGWLPPRHADAIYQMLERNNLAVSNLWRTVAGADLFSKRPDGRTVADTYREYGLQFKPANTDRIAGASEILSRLGDTDPPENPIPPRLFITERCVRLIECLPSLQHDPNRPEDVLKVDIDDDGNGGDDAYDSCRYGIMEAVRKPQTHAAPPLVAKGSGWN